jgi:hypothetical protein
MEAELITCGRQTDRETDGHTDLTNLTLHAPFTITRTRLIKDRGKLRSNLEYAYFRNAVLWHLMPCLMGLIVHSYCLLKIQISHSDACILFQSYRNRGAKQHNRKSKTGT